MEYALILVLVAIVVVVVLALLGPAIGNVFNSVLAGISNGGAAATATPTPTPTPTAWTFCANENGLCAIPSGSHQVRYGANGTYLTQTYAGPANVNCSNAGFGSDPVPNVVKHCDYQ